MCIRYSQTSKASYYCFISIVQNRCLRSRNVAHFLLTLTWKISGDGKCPHGICVSCHVRTMDSKEVKTGEACSLWATVCSPYAIGPLSVCLSVCLSCCPVCIVGALWPNGWMDQGETWHAGRPRPGHTVLDGDPAPLPKWAQPPAVFGPYLLRPNGWMD